jgi:hypothetical protein
MLGPLAPCGGMPELLTPKEVTSINSKGRFLTTGKSLPPVVFSASLGWLILSAPENKGHHLHRPIQVEGTDTMGCCPVPRRDHNDTAITTPVPCSPWHNTSHLGFRGPEMSPPPHNEDAKGWILEGYITYVSVHI